MSVFRNGLWDRNLIEKYRADNAVTTERNRPILPPQYLSSRLSVSVIFLSRKRASRGSTPPTQTIFAHPVKD